MSDEADPVRDALGAENVSELLYGEHALSMKPLLMVAIREVVKLALIDSVSPPGRDEEGRSLIPSDEEKRPPARR